MVSAGGGRWCCGLPGYKKLKRRWRKSCQWTGLIHSGEDSTKSGIQKMNKKKSPVDMALTRGACAACSTLDTYLAPSSVRLSIQLLRLNGGWMEPEAQF